MNDALNNTVATPSGGMVQRDEAETSPSPGPQRQLAMSGIDLEDLLERVYRRWQDELRLERERGAW